MIRVACIYKITNLINKKIYIGYTSRNNIKIRFKEHITTARYYNKHKKEKRTYLHKAILHYGERNFIIEEVYKIPVEEEENWQDIEKYYIAKYSSNDREVGYNMTEGGERPNIQYGDDNVGARLNNKQFFEIVKRLKEEKMIFSEIAEKYQTHITTVERINKGQIRKQDNWEYPIRKNNPHELKAERIMSLLINTDLKYEIINDIVGVGNGVATSINTGKRYRYFFKNIKYPVKENIEYNKQFYTLEGYDELTLYKLKTLYATKEEEQTHEISRDIILSDDNLTEIARKHHIHPSTVSRVNTGDRNILKIFSFPLNKNKKINKKILNRLEAVETIPLIGK